MLITSGSEESLSREELLADRDVTIAALLVEIAATKNSSPPAITTLTAAVRWEPGCLEFRPFRASRIRSLLPA